MEVKTEACERLLGFRVDQKMRTKKVDNILNRLHVAMPEPRDNKDRPAFIPESVLQKREIDEAIKEKRKLEKDIEEEMGDDYTVDLKKHYVTIPEEERYDIIPEFLEGHNIADYIDADIFEKLEELERDEGLRLEGGFYEPPKINMDETLQEIRDMARQIRTKRFILRDNKRLAPRADKPKIPRHKQAHTRERKAENLMNTMEDLGVDMSGAEKANFNKNKIVLRKSIVGGVPTKKKDKESMAVVKSTGEPLKRRHPKHELGLSNQIVSFLEFPHQICLNLLDFPGEEEGAGAGQARHRQEVEEDVSEGRGGSFHWRPQTEASVRWKAWNWQNRSPLNYQKFSLFFLSTEINKKPRNSQTQQVELLEV
jgi:nucleolar GTP-binding protein